MQIDNLILDEAIVNNEFEFHSEERQIKNVRIVQAFHRIKK